MNSQNLENSYATLVRTASSYMGRTKYIRHQSPTVARNLAQLFMGDEVVGVVEAFCRRRPGAMEGLRLILTLTESVHDKRCLSGDISQGICQIRLCRLKGARDQPKIFTIQTLASARIGIWQKTQRDPATCAPLKPERTAFD